MPGMKGSGFVCEFWGQQKSGGAKMRPKPTQSLGAEDQTHIPRPQFRV